MGDASSKRQTFIPDQPVEWISSGVKKSGVILSVVPKGHIPKELAHKIGPWQPRDHESYIVAGVRSVQRRGESKSRQVKALYWPRVSLLRANDSLTPEEMNWCRSHPKEIRKLIAES